nr:nucleolar protein 15 [Cryptococcus depauperatus CBS 7855]
MAPKRAAPSSKSAPNSKKSKPSSKGTKTKPTKETPLDTIKNVASSLLDTVSDAVDAAGNLVLDGGDPAPVDDVVNENVNVPALKQKGKAVKGKVEEKAAEVTEKAKESAKPIKGKAEKALKDAQKKVEKTDTKALKDKASKVAIEAASSVEQAVRDPKNRKRAEDFLESAETAVYNIASKVGGVLEDTLEQFGEASGAAGVAEGLVKKEKKATSKKAKTLPKQAKEIKENPKRKAREAVEDIEPVAKKTRSLSKSEQDQENEDEDVHMHDFSSSDGGADSSDDESDVEDLAIVEAARKVDIGSLPMDVNKGTLFLGRIPHGFYEDQMKEYFSQFGDVTRIRLARNRKTGASKHYAYIEMSSESVATIVAETMNNYLLLGHLLQCEVIPADKVHPQLWVGANKKFRKIPRARVELMKHDKQRTDEQKDKADKKLLKKQGQRKKKLEKAGIDYEFEGHVSLYLNRIKPDFS